MKLVYLRGKTPRILDNCGFHRKYDSYFRRLVRYDGVEWLNSMKVLGKIDDKGMYCPEFPHSITPTYQKEVARKLGLRISMAGLRGEDDALYYYNGRYHRAKELFN